MPAPHESAAARARRAALGHRENESAPAGVYLRRALWFSAAALAFLLAAGTLVAVVAFGALLWLIFVVLVITAAGAARIAAGWRHRNSSSR